MNKTNDLFNLVKSLNKQEKRFFKLYAQLYTHNKTPDYVCLFDIIDGMKNFDNDELNAEVKKKIANKNLSQLKHYLKDSIYTSLKLFHKKNNTTVQDYEILGFSKILVDKRLYSQAKKILLQLKTKAIKSENFSLLILINDIILNLNNTVGNRVYEVQFENSEFLKETKYFLEQKKIKTQLNIILNKIPLFLYSKNKLKTDIKTEYINILEGDLALFRPEDIKSKLVKYTYYHLKFILYSALDKNKECLETLKTLQELIKEPEFDVHLNYKCAVYSTSLLVYTEIYNPKAFQLSLSLFSKLLDDYPYLKTRNLYWMQIRTINFYSLNTNLILPTNLFASILEDLNKLSNKISDNDKSGLLVSMAIYSFAMEDFEKCRDFLSQITLNNKVSINNFHYLQTHILEILCYYELKYLQLSKNKILSIERKFKKENISKFSLLTLAKTLRKFINSNNKPVKHKKHLNELATLIENNKKFKIYQADFSFFQNWVRKKQLSLIKLYPESSFKKN